MTDSAKRHIAWDAAILAIGSAALIVLVLVGAF
jgi:hypothetical protein